MTSPVGHMMRLSRNFPVLALAATLATGSLAGATESASPAPQTNHRVDSPSVLQSAANSSLAVYRGAKLALQERIDAREKPKPLIMNWQRLADDVAITPVYSRYSMGLASAESYEANRRLNPTEMATVLEKEYGSGSMLARTGLALARWAVSYETRTQVPLDRVNNAADGLVNKARVKFDMPRIPLLNLRSEVSLRGIELGLRHRW